ncbi:hypothetical protein ABLU29_02505 [Lactococcus lactis]|uniref:hypothetical protein n=1 Tax=Lactococcus lactis TaxID=1358 RepID=UPI003877DC50
MKKLTTTLMLALVATSTVASVSTLSVSADDLAKDSKVTAAITGGALSLTQPNDDTLAVTLTGDEQTVELDDINFNVTDARGLADDKSGWDITVASDNYDTYKKDYTLKLGTKDISADEVQVDAVTEKTVTKAEDLAASATVSATAKATSEEVANLQWTLAPTTASVSE